MIRLPGNLIMKLKNEGKQLRYGQEIKYHRSTAKYPVLDRNVVSGGFAPHIKGEGTCWVHVHVRTVLML